MGLPHDQLVIALVFERFSPACHSVDKCYCAGSTQEMFPFKRARCSHLLILMLNYQVLCVASTYLLNPPAPRALPQPVGVFLSVLPISVSESRVLTLVRNGSREHGIM